MIRFGLGYQPRHAYGVAPGTAAQRRRWAVEQRRRELMRATVALYRIRAALPPPIAPWRSSTPTRPLRALVAPPTATLPALAGA